MCLLIVGTSHAQEKDTLSIVKHLDAEGKTRQALRLMENYYPAHQEDFFATWIYAQVAFRAERYRLSSQLYEKAIRKHPDDYILELDYAKSLVYAGSFKRASERLNRITETDISAPEPWLYLSMIENWRGEPRKALGMLDNLIKNAPGYVPAQKLREEILLDRAPWLALNGLYSSDDQPLQLVVPDLRGGWYRSHLLGLDIQMTFPFSPLDSGTFWSFGLNAGNRFHFSKPNLNLYLNVGFFHHATLNTTNWTGAFKLEKIFFRKMPVWFEATRKPFLSTEGSFRQPVIENHYTLAVAWDDPDSWNGRLSAERSTFSTDNNRVTAFCGWLFVPAIKLGPVKLHFGYGYNYSDAKESRYVSKEPLDVLIAKWDTGMVIEGVYDPYFTPNNQQIHSLLGTIELQAAQNLSFAVKANYGIYGTTLYPYLFFDSNSTDSLFINRAFTKETFHPWNLGARINWAIGRTFELSADYSYNSTLYYTSNVFGLTLCKKIR